MKTFVGLTLLLLTAACSGDSPSGPSSQPVTTPAAQVAPTATVPAAAPTPRPEPTSQRVQGTVYTFKNTGSVRAQVFASVWKGYDIATQVLISDEPIELAPGEVKTRTYKTPACGPWQIDLAYISGSELEAKGKGADYPAGELIASDRSGLNVPSCQQPAPSPPTPTPTPTPSPSPCAVVNPPAVELVSSSVTDYSPGHGVKANATLRVRTGAYTATLFAKHGQTTWPPKDTEQETAACTDGWQEVVLSYECKDCHTNTPTWWVDVRGTLPAHFDLVR